MSLTLDPAFEPALDLGSTSVAGRLAALRRRAADDSPAAREEAWAWFAEAGDRLRRDRRSALADLGELFAGGRPSVGIDGQTDGALVGFTLFPAFDRSLAAITDLWMPWVGKRFEAAHERGDNTLARSAVLPSRIPWPRYRMTPKGKTAVAFDFTTRVEAGVLDPGTDVLVIDYASVADNPGFLITSIRDELVEVVPGAHLGKMLWVHRGGRKHTLLAYFALKSLL